MVETPLRLDQVIVAQQTTDSQVIGWRLLGIGSAVVSALVKIYRSYVENDGFTLVGTVAAQTGFYRDDTVNLHDQWRKPFYKLEVVDSFGNTRMYGPVSVSSELDGLGITLIKASQTSIRLGGNPVLIYQRKFDTSNRCDVCWDEVMHKVMQSNCESCYNTGFEGGYHYPVLTLTLIAPIGKQNNPTDALRQFGASEFLCSNYPILRPKDLIYEVNTGHRYRVGNIRTAEKHRVLINQTFSVELLHPDDIEHRLPVPDISAMAPILIRPTAASRVLVVDNYSPSDPTIGYIYI